MDSENDPTNEQLAEITHLVGEEVRAQSVRIQEMIRSSALSADETSKEEEEKPKLAASSLEAALDS